MAADLVAALLPRCLPTLLQIVKKFRASLQDHYGTVVQSLYSGGIKQLIQPTTLENMNKEQTAAALQLLALLEGDAIADANASIYGRWHEHLADQLSDEHVEQLSFSCKALHPV